MYKLVKSKNKKDDNRTDQEIKSNLTVQGVQRRKQLSSF